MEREEKKMTGGVSRRGFLQGAVFGGALLAWSGSAIGCAPQKGAAGSDQSAELSQTGAGDATANSATQFEPGEIVQTIDCDVAVVGGGGAGCTCAARASELGAKVALIEKTITLGGCSANSGGSCCTSIGSQLQKELGIECDANEMVKKWIHDQQYHCNERLVRRFLTSSGAAVDWMSEHGWNFIEQKNGLTYAVGWKDKKGDERAALFAGCRDVVEQSGGAVMMSTTGRKLITNDEGSVCGLYAVNENGETIQINAKAVVLATGGFAGNAELCEQLVGFELYNGGLPGNIGEGMEMAQAVGAGKPANFGAQLYHQSRSTYQGPDGTLRSFMTKYLNYCPATMAVDCAGVRFRNEDEAVNFYGGPNSAVQVGGRYYTIVSQGMIDALETGGLQAMGFDSTTEQFPYAWTVPHAGDEKPEPDTVWTGLTEVLEDMVAQGCGFKGATAKELAENAGFDIVLFESNLKAYDEACEAGVDALLGKPAAYLVKYGPGPYYAIEGEPVTLGTVGSLIVNDKFQVLTDGRVPIPGLYSCGTESASQLYHENYFLDGGGAGIGFAWGSGLLAGSDAAEYALAE